MSAAPEPPAGIYLDSCGTRYLATREKRTGWWIHKRPGPLPAAFQREDFPEAVKAGIFIFSPETT